YVLDIDLRNRPKGYRVPDIFRKGTRVGDVKNVDRQDLDSQMRDNVRIAQGNLVRVRGESTLIPGGARFDLIVRAPSDAHPKGTAISGNLRIAVANTGGFIFELL
ncbi:MAG TPA: putative toxin, partial [Nitrospira sp.]|nr:putative toxin [Nitrospira sp.]